jgi:sec-independent protein translocase protein TatA
MGLFDSPWHILIVVLVLVLLFGSAKLPKAAQSLGQAMRIFKTEAQKLHNDDANQQQGVAQQQFAAQQQLPAQQSQAQAPLVTQPAPVQQAPAPPPAADVAPPPPAGNQPS